MPKAIEVRDLRISYKSIKPVSVKSGLKDLFQRRSHSFEAIKGVSFEVQKGEIIGIIGENGSGKSTLLRTIAGIFSPDKGTIKTFKNKVSLLAIGVGFQKELTGRTNIILSGMLLGFTEIEIRKRLKEIIDFSELGRFIDQPVKTYSSGMYSKLAFAITAILEADIMLIDEVFSVGDARFKKKSFDKMSELISDARRTVLIVSHNSNSIKRLCDRVIWMHKGKIVAFGETSEVLAAYESFVQSNSNDETTAVIYTDYSDYDTSNQALSEPISLSRLITGETIFSRQLRLLKECGIKKCVAIIASHEEEFNHQSHIIDGIDVVFVVNSKCRESNDVYSMIQSRKHVQGCVLLLNSRLVFNKHFLQKMLLDNRSVLVCVDRKNKGKADDYIVKTKSNTVLSISANSSKKNAGIFLPIVKMDAFSFDYFVNLSRKKALSSDDVPKYEDLLHKMIGNVKMHSISSSLEYVNIVRKEDDFENTSKMLRRYDIKEIPVFKKRSSINWVYYVFKSEGVKRPMIICDASAIKQLPKTMFDIPDIECLFYSDFPSDFTDNDIDDAVEIYVENRCDFIVSVGPAKVVDMAKCIKLFLSRQFIPTSFHGSQEYKWIPVKQLAIPSSAGSGSESTCFASFLCGQTIVTQVFESIRPDYVILDANMIDSKNYYIKESAYIEALGNCIDALFSTHITKTSRMKAKKAFLILLNENKDFFSNNRDSIQKVLDASNLAGQAINTTMGSIVYMFSRSISSYFNVEHGHAVAMSLPVILRFIVEKKDVSYRKNSVRISLLNLCRFFETDSIDNALKSFSGLLSNFHMDIPNKASDMVIDELFNLTDFGCLDNCIVPFSRQDVRDMYRMILS